MTVKWFQRVFQISLGDAVYHTLSGRPASHKGTLKLQKIPSCRENLLDSLTTLSAYVIGSQHALLAKASVPILRDRYPTALTHLRGH